MLDRCFDREKHAEDRACGELSPSVEGKIAPGQTQPWKCQSHIQIWIDDGMTNDYCGRHKFGRHHP